MSGAVQELIGLGHRHALGTLGDLLDPIACADLSFFEHAQIESRPAVRHHQCGHGGKARANAHFETGDAWLRDFEQRRADAKAIADTDLRVCQTRDGQVLPEEAVLEIRSAEMRAPIFVGLELIHHDGALFAAVTHEIRLSIAREIETARLHSAANRTLPDRGSHEPSAPTDVLRRSDVHRDHAAHESTVTA
jgi:hypothetical protein